jgi:imidazole glycerol-phosphate synthase subunit HisF
VRKIRVIPRLDIKFPNLIKGIRLEGLRVVGNPADFAHDYYDQGADELLYMDNVASLYERNTISDLIEKTACNIFIPLTVGGGIRSAEDAKRILRSGADKVAINTAAIKDPEILSEISDSFGNQCVVLSVEAKKIGPNEWEAYYDNGRERSGVNVMEWVETAQKLGIGEIIVTSIDQEGTQKGFEIDLIKRVCEISSVPVIASGGMENLDHVRDLLLETSVDAIAIAHALHYKKETIASIKTFIKQLGFEVRA